MQSTVTTKEQLCNKCCEILNKSNFSSAEEWTKLTISYERSPDDLQASADGGCRFCQIIWLYTIFILKEYFTITSKHTIRMNIITRRKELHLETLLCNGPGESSMAALRIDFLDKQKSPREMPPIMRMTG